MNPNDTYLIIIIIYLFVFQIAIFGIIAWVYWSQINKKFEKQPFFAIRFDYFNQSKLSNRWDIFSHNYFYWHNNLPFIPQNFISENNFFSFFPPKQKLRIKIIFEEMFDPKKTMPMLINEKIIIKTPEMKQNLYLTVDAVDRKQKMLSGTITNYFSLKKNSRK